MPRRLPSPSRAAPGRCHGGGRPRRPGNSVCRLRAPHPRFPLDRPAGAARRAQDGGRCPPSETGRPPTGGSDETPTSTPHTAGTASDTRSPRTPAPATRAPVVGLDPDLGHAVPVADISRPGHGRPTVTGPGRLTMTDLRTPQAVDPGCDTPGWLTSIPPAVLRELAALVERRHHLQFIDPARAAAELAVMLDAGTRPTIGWYRRHTSRASKGSEGFDSGCPGPNG